MCVCVCINLHTYSLDVCVCGRGGGGGGGGGGGCYIRASRHASATVSFQKTRRTPKVSNSK